MGWGDPEDKKSPDMVETKSGSEQYRGVLSAVSLRRPFRSFKWIDADLCNLNLRFLVGGKVADTKSPFGIRISVGFAVFNPFFLDDALASLTLIDNRLECAF